MDETTPAVQQLMQEIAALRLDNERLRNESSEVASANARAAMKLVDLIEARQFELEQQKAELQRALDIATEANRKKDDFLSMISHELRTPLNGILGMVALAAESPLTQQQHDCLDSATLSARHLLRIIEDLLSFSQLSSGHRSLAHVPTDLWALAEEMLPLFAPRLARTPCDFGVFIDPAVPRHAVLDEAHLSQVLFNLIDNALKFTRRGEIRLELSLEQDDPICPRIRFEVRDTGIGIDRSQLKEIFASFSQVHRFHTRPAGGTGLGLAISQAILALMEGQIDVRSSPGEGSSFWFTIPLRRDTGSANPPIRAAWQRAVCVTRNRFLAEWLRRHLEAWGVQARCATNLAEAATDAQAANAQAADAWLIDAAQLNPTALPLLRGATQSGGATPRILVVEPYDRPVPGALLAEAGIHARLRAPVAPSRLLAEVLGQDPAGEANSIATTPPTTAAQRRRVARATAANNPERAAPPFANLRVLVVEDNPINQKVARGMLRRLGCDTTICDDGPAALAELAAQTFDIVLMDCQMPGMDGFEVARAIRKQDSACRTIPIVAVTANAMLGDRERCIDAGMNDYMPKPFGLEDLQTAISRHIAARPAASTDPESLR